MKELKQSIKNMDYKKAVGPDGIANAFLKHATDELLGISLKFLNLNIKHDMASSNWCHDFITPIHKEGPNITQVTIETYVLRIHYSSSFVP